MGKPASDFFTNAQKNAITDAVKQAELETSGEIRVHIENHCKGDVLDRAATIFDKLGMVQTELRNGVLVYLAIDDRKLAILGDMGINAKVPEGFWDEVRDTMVGHFREGRFAEGLEEGINMAGLQLKTWFPRQTDDVNELPDDISFG